MCVCARARVYIYIYICIVCVCVCVCVLSRIYLQLKTLTFLKTQKNKINVNNFQVFTQSPNLCLSDTGIQRAKTFHRQ